MQRLMRGRIPFALTLTLALQMSGVAFGRDVPGGEEFLRGQPNIRAKFAALFENNPGIRLDIDAMPHSC